MAAIIICLAITVLALYLLAKLGMDQAALTGQYFQKKVLSEPEQVTYWRLEEAFRGEKVILSQVAFSSFIGTKGGKKKGRFAKFSKARQKVADFVICNKDFSIYAIVEVDDASHDKEKDRLRDLISEEAGIKTFRIEAMSIPSANELRKAINDECLHIS